MRWQNGSQKQVLKTSMAMIANMLCDAINKVHKK